MLNLARRANTLDFTGYQKMPTTPYIFSLILSINPGSDSMAAYSSSAGALSPLEFLSGLYQILSLYQ